MNIDLVVVGKSSGGFVTDAIKEYTKRLGKYVKFSIVELADIKGAKNMTESLLKEREGVMLLSTIKNYDYIVLLDNNGKEYYSEEFAQWIEKRQLLSTKRVAFVIGGAYGFSKDVYAIAKEKISLSRMTFSHQMIRMIFVEQLYRAFTIIKGEPYHHS